MLSRSCSFCFSARHPVVTSCSAGCAPSASAASTCGRTPQVAAPPAMSAVARSQRSGGRWKPPWGPWAAACPPPSPASPPVLAPLPPLPGAVRKSSSCWRSASGIKLSRTAKWLHHGRVCVCGGGLNRESSHAEHWRALHAPLAPAPLQPAAGTSLPVAPAVRLAGRARCAPVRHPRALGRCLAGHDAAVECGVERDGRDARVPVGGPGRQPAKGNWVLRTRGLHLRDLPPPLLPCRRQRLPLPSIWPAARRCRRCPVLLAGWHCLVCHAVGSLNVPINSKKEVLMGLLICYGRR